MATSDPSFNALVAALCSSDNGTRQQAERYYLGIRDTTPERLVLPLVALIGDSLGSTSADAAQARTMCAVLLRPLMKNSAMWSALPAASREAAKDVALRAVTLERTAYAQRNLCHCVATLAAATFSSGGGSDAAWPALIPCVLALLDDAHAPTREIATQLVRVLAIALAQRSDLIVRNAGALLGALWVRLTEDPSLAVRVVAARCVSALLTCVHRDGDAAAAAWEAKLAPFLAAILAALNATLAARDEERGRAALEALVDVAELRPTFFAAPAQFAQLAASLSAVAAAASLEVGTRGLALEVLIVLLEADPSLCAAVESRPLLASLCELTLGMVANVDAERTASGVAFDAAEAGASAWQSVGPLGDDVSTASYTGGDAFERLTGAMGPGALEVAWPFLQSMLNGGGAASPGGAASSPASPSPAKWGARWAALIALALLGEGCKEALQAQAGAVAAMIARFGSDPIPDVRFACAHAIGQLAGDLKPALQADAASLSLCFGCLSRLLADASPRVAACAANALTRLCDPTICDFSDAVPEDALRSLLALLGSETISAVHLSAVTALASIAQVCGPAVCGGSFYDAVMPVAKGLAVRSSAAATAANPHRAAARMLRGKAIECVGLVGCVAGAERFSADARWLMEFIVHLGAGAAGTIAEDDDCTLQYILTTSTRVAQCLGPSGTFSAYLPSIIPPLVEILRLKETDAPSVERLGNEEAEQMIAASGGGVGALAEAETEMALAAVSGVTIDRVTVRSEAMREKALASQTIWQLLDDLQSEMVPFIQVIGDVVLPLIAFKHSEEIRAVSVSIVPKMLIALTEGTQYCETEAEAGRLAALASALLAQAFPMLLSAVQQEETVDVLGMTIEAIAGTTRACDEARKMGIPLIFPAHFVQPSAAALAKVLSAAIQRRADCVLEHTRRRGGGAGGAGGGAADAAAVAAAEAMRSMSMAELGEAIQTEEQIFESVVETNSALARTLGAAYGAAFTQHIQPLSLALLKVEGASGGPLVQSVGVCVAIDIIEFCQPFAAALVPIYSATIFAAAESADSQLRQAASYGIGVIAQQCPALDAQPGVLRATLERLATAIARPDAYSPEYALATDNAIVAVGKMLRFRGGALGVGAASGFASGIAGHAATHGHELVPRWSSWLPLRHDTIEAQGVHRLLCGAIVRVAMLGQGEEGLPPIAQEVSPLEAASLLGPELSNLPHLLRALGRALCFVTSPDGVAAARANEGEGVMDEEAMATAAQLLQMASAGGGSPLAAAGASIDARERAAWAACQV